jgi:Uma2 family endonuclease
MQTGEQQSITAQRDRRMTFEEYINFDDGTDYRYELIDGELVQLPPESGRNDEIAQEIFWALASAQVVDRRLIKLHTCEVQVPVLKQGDAANRYPDLVILQEVHRTLTEQRLTIRLEMPSPRLVGEVLSPGKTNRDRDLVRKWAQYAARRIPEYWLVDPQEQTVTVLKLVGGEYSAVGLFRGDDRLTSPELGVLELTANQIFAAGE